jgi:hypothetical protein
VADDVTNDIPGMSGVRGKLCLKVGNMNLYCKAGNPAECYRGAFNKAGPNP